MVRNGADEIAISYYQPTGHYVKLGNGHEYVFRTVRNVCLAWVKPEDVDKLLEITKTCCGGTRNKVFRYSTQQEVNLWTGVGDFHP